MPGISVQPRQAARAIKVLASKKNPAIHTAFAARPRHVQPARVAAAWARAPDVKVAGIEPKAKGVRTG